MALECVGCGAIARRGVFCEGFKIGVCSRSTCRDYVLSLCSSLTERGKRWNWFSVPRSNQT